jgi:DNA-binding transcriptional LysR family regulator
VVDAAFPRKLLLSVVTELRLLCPNTQMQLSDAVLTIKDLVSHLQCVVRDSGTRHPRDDGWLGASARCTVTSVEASLAIVEAGLAFAWLPVHLVEEPLRRGALRELPLGAGRTRKLPLSVVLVQSDCAGPAARAAVECFQRHVPPRRIQAVQQPAVRRPTRSVSRVRRK